MLVRTFSLLDELPRPSLGGEFTSKTIAIALENDAPDSWKGFSLQSALRSDAARRGIVCVSWLVGLSLAVVTGFLLTSGWIPNESQMLVDDLPVIESLDELSKVENIEFLRELKARVGSFHDNGENSRK
jgi:hypothetical protein